MFAEQYYGLPKIRITQGRGCDQENAFCKWGFHLYYPTALLYAAQAARQIELLGSVGPVHLVYFVYLAALVQPNKPV
jgi:hypothetical protein